ncbi:MAG: response regulator [Desulfuromonadales bacterium]|nr:response regulator [Desulfuromonadales bacterium]
MKSQILIVDDSETIREALSQIIRDAGFTVLVAENGKEALSICENSTPSMLISDLNMPGMDGFSLVTTVRKMPGNRFMPIIILSSESITHKERAKQAGASGWISKPFKPEQVISIIKMVVG